MGVTIKDKKSKREWRSSEEIESKPRVVITQEKTANESVVKTAQQQYEDAYQRAQQRRREIGDIMALGANMGSYERSRVANTVNAGAYGAAAGYANALGTAAASVGQNDKTERERWQRSLEASLKQYRNARTDADRAVAMKYVGEAQKNLAYFREKEAEETKTERAFDKASTAAQRAADRMQEKSGEYTARAKDGLGKVGQLLVDAGISGTQMLGDAALNALAPGAGLAAMGVRAFGSGAQEARREGANYRQQLLYGGANAAVEVLSEKMFDGLSGVYGKGFLDKSALAQGVSRAFSRMERTAAGRTAKAMLGSMGEEALEEVVAGAIEPAFRSIYNGKKVRENYGADTVTDIVESAIVGGLLGGIGGAGQVMNNARQTRAYKGTYGADSAALVQEALDIDPENKTAQRAQERLRRGKELSGAAVRRLVDENEAAMRGTTPPALRATSPDLSPNGDKGRQGQMERATSPDLSPYGDKSPNGDKGRQESGAVRAATQGRPYGDGAARATGTTAIDDDPRSHTGEQQANIEAYKKHNDTALRSFVEKVRKIRDNDYRNKIRHEITTETENAAKKAAELTGVDTTGYKSVIKGNAVQHIDRRHGENGEADRSMANPDDFSRIGFVLDHFTEANVVSEKDVDEETTKLSREWKNADGSRAKIIRYTMPVDGGYYVVEAVPDSKAKNMAVVSAYMEQGKKTGRPLNQVLNMEQNSPQRTPEAPVEISESSMPTIPQSAQEVKSPAQAAYEQTYNQVRRALTAGQEDAQAQEAARYAAQYPGMEEIYTQFRPAGMSAQEWDSAWRLAYEMGAGTETAAVERNLAAAQERLRGVIAPEITEVAFQAGRESGAADTSSVTAEAVPPSPRGEGFGAASGGADGMNIENTMGGSAYGQAGIGQQAGIGGIRPGGQWADGTGTEGQIAAVEGGAGQNRGAEAEAVSGAARGTTPPALRATSPDKGRQEKIESATSPDLSSGEDKGSQESGAGRAATQGRPYGDGEVRMHLPEGVTAQEGVREVKDAGTRDRRRAQAMAQRRGLKVHFFAGGNLVCDGVVCNGMIENGEVWVRCDDPDFPAEQIMEHECTHDAIAKGEIDPESAWRKLEKQFGRERMDGWVEDYREALTGAELLDMEIEEEILCDAVAGMNKLRGKLDTQAGEYGEMLGLARGEVEQQRERKRGPPEANKKPTEVGGKKSYVGKRADGIEVYETSDETMSMTRKERQKKFLSLMENEYRGRTAKFIRNGHAYYARFDDGDIRKNIYGDKKSDSKGYRAKIDEGADGSVFQLVENAQYSGSKAEIGKNISAHTGVKSWDYFVKTVQINGHVYDIVANVRKKAGEEYIYSLQLRTNKKEVAAPATATEGGIQKGEATSGNSISTSSEKSKRKLSAVARDSEGRQLTAQQEEYFKDSKVRDEDDLLVPVYHTTDELFFEFEREKLGSITDSNAMDVGLAATSHVGFWFNTGDIKGKTKQPISMQGYLNIKRPYYAGDLQGLANDIIERFGEDYNDLQDRFDEADYEVTREMGETFASWLEWNGYDGVCIEDEEFGGTSYVALKSEQFKNTDNENPTDNPDIRFSTSGAVSMEDLKAQNDALKEQVKALNKEKYALAAKLKNKTERVNYFRDRATFSPEKVGKEILQAYHSTLNEEDIHEDVKALLSYASRRSGITYETLKNMAGETARRIVQSAEVLEEGSDDYSAIRDYHRKNRIAVSEAVKNDFGEDWGAWQRRNGMRLGLRNSEGVPVDVVYEELREKFGEAYYPADITHPADQLRRMEEILDKKPGVVNPYGYNMAYAVESCANELCDMVLKDVNEGFTKTYSYQLNEKNYRIRQEAKERMEKQSERSGIAKTVRALDRALRTPTDDNHIPETMREAVETLVGIFADEAGEVGDHAIFTKDKLAQIGDYYRNVKEDEVLGDRFDEETEARLTRLRDTIDGKRISQLTLQELRDVRAVVQHFRFLQNKADSVFINGRKARIETVAQGMIESARMKGPHTELTLPGGKGLAVKHLLKEGNLTPTYFFRHIGDTGLTRLWSDVLRGQSRCGLRLREADEAYERIAKKHGLKTWLDEKKRLKTHDATGHYVEMDMEQAMYLYAAWQREKRSGNTEHLLGGGFVFEEDAVAQKKLKGLVEKHVTEKQTHTIDEEFLARVEAWLRKQDSRILPYIDEMVDYLSQDMAELGNETSLALHGYRKFEESYYVPIRSASEYLEQRFDQQRRGKDSVNFKNKGFTKRTQAGANNPIVLQRFDEVWVRHVTDMVNYSSMAVAQDNLQRIMNYKTPVDKQGKTRSASVREALKGAYGEKAVDYIDTLMGDINGGLLTDSRESTLNRMVSTFKKNAVAASLSVSVQQPSSITRAMAVVNPKYFTKTAAKKRDWEKVKRYSGVAVIKEIGGFDTTTGKSAQDWLSRHAKRKTAMDKIDNAAMWLPGEMDKVTWCHIFNAVEAEIADTTDLQKGSEAFHERVGERFDEVIELTQVYDSVLARSENMRSQGGIMKMATSFMAEPTLTMNMVTDAVQGVKAGREGAKAYLGRAMGAVLGNIVLNNLLKALATAPRDKDKDKTLAEKYMGKLAKGIKEDLLPWNYVPVLSDLVDSFSGYSQQMPYAQPFTEAWDAFAKLWDDTDGLRQITVDGDWSGVTVDNMAAIVGGVAGLFGVPVRNLWRDSYGLAQGILGSMPIAGTTMKSAGDAFLEGLKRERSTGDVIEDYYYAFRRDSQRKQEKAKQDMEALWQKKYRKYLARGLSEEQAAKEANGDLKGSVTQVLKPKYNAAGTQGEKNRYIEIARRIYVGGHQLYDGYDFDRFWRSEE